MTRFLIAIGLLLLTACQNSESDPKLEQAFAAHQLALRTLDSLEQELKTLQAQSLTEEQQQEWSRIQETSTLWESNLVEVPGYDHAEGHDHGHDHDHDHDAMTEDLKDLPPAEILRIQQALVDEVQQLLAETRQLAVKANPVSP